MTHARGRFLLLALFVLATSVWAGAMLRRLNGVRARAAVLTAGADVPIRSGDPVAAIRAGRAGRDVVIARLAATGRTGGHVRAAVTLLGPELAVRRMIGRIETGRPAVRFGTWQLRPEPGSADRVRFDATAFAVPERRR